MERSAHKRGVEKRKKRKKKVGEQRRGMVLETSYYDEGPEMMIL